MGRSPWFDWATDTFDHADTLRDRIPAALSKAHSRARAGHDATNSGSLRIFGTALWEFQNVELVSAVSSMATARAVKFGGYELPVVENCVLFPCDTPTEPEYQWSEPGCPCQFPPNVNASSVCTHRM